MAKTAKHLSRIWISTIFLLLTPYVIADETSVQDLISENIINSNLSRPMCSDNLRCSSLYTKQFYQKESGEPVWSQEGITLPTVDRFITILSNSYQDGLNPESYHLEVIKKLKSDLNAIPIADASEERVTILADLDTTLTDAFFIYASNLAYGKINNKEVYPNWIITKRSVDLMSKFNEAHSGNIQDVLDSLSPHYPEYMKLKEKLAKYQRITMDGGWPMVEAGPKLQIGDHGKRVNELQRRLLVTGELDKIHKKGTFDQSLKEALIKFQMSHGLKGDGIAGAGTVQALSVSAKMRTQQIELNMDRLRWLPSDLGRRYILVNIPDYSLTVMENGKKVMTMPVIVGKDEGLQSCVLSSKINYLEFNPYWYIPKSIAVKDILPKLKKNPNYLNEKDIQVFTDYGSSPLNSKEIKWSKIEPNTFIYKLREEPGEENPLGRVKFIFPNTCGIYLHDTSNPELFKKSKRTFSHGCIRIGKPIELATYLLADKPNWAEDKILAKIETGDNKAINLTDPINIHIVYATAWVDQDNVLQFRNDVYNIDSIPYNLALPEIGTKTKPE